VETQCFVTAKVLCPSEEVGCHGLLVSQCSRVTSCLTRLFIVTETLRPATAIHVGKGLSRQIQPRVWDWTRSRRRRDTRCAFNSTRQERADDASPAGIRTWGPRNSTPPVERGPLAWLDPFRRTALRGPESQRVSYTWPGQKSKECSKTGSRPAAFPGNSRSPWATTLLKVGRDNQEENSGPRREIKPSRARPPAPRPPAPRRPVPRWLATGHVSANLASASEPRIPGSSAPPRLPYDRRLGRRTCSWPQLSAKISRRVFRERFPPRDDLPSDRESSDPSQETVDPFSTHFLLSGQGHPGNSS